MRLIDAKELKRKILDSCFLPDWSKVLINRLVDEQPTIEVEPIVHAHWIVKTEKGGYMRTVCSNCGTEVADSYGDKNHNSYCDCCGAKMDEEE